MEWIIRSVKVILRLRARDKATSIERDRCKEGPRGVSSKVIFDVADVRRNMKPILS